MAYCAMVESVWCYGISVRGMVLGVTCDWESYEWMANDI